LVGDQRAELSLAEGIFASFPEKSVKEKQEGCFHRRKSRNVRGILGEGGRELKKISLKKFFKFFRWQPFFVVSILF
jgi:hypothetical protein